MVKSLVCDIHGLYYILIVVDEVLVFRLPVCDVLSI